MPFAKYKNIYVFKYRVIDYPFLIINKMRGSEIYYWKTPKSCNFKRILPTNVCDFLSNKKKSRAVFEDYFSKNIHCNDTLLLQYIKKTIISEFDEYYAFRQSIDHKTSQKYSIFGGGIYDFIYENRAISKNYALSLNYGLSVLKLLIFASKSYYLTKKTIASLEKKDIIYLRRKILPDAFSYTHKVFHENNISFVGVIFSFNSKNSKYGLYFLSSFLKSSEAVRKAFVKVIISIKRDTNIFNRLSISSENYYTYIRDLFCVLTLIELDPKVIYGSLVDRSYGLLLYRHKKEFQKICMHSDGFSFPPDPGPEYVYSDIFYGMNDIDITNMNHCGGFINTVNEVGFYRQSVKADSKGVSQDLMLYIKQYRSTILVVLNTVRVDKYFDIDLEYFESFLVEIIEQSKIYHDSLFVIKGKKGELDLLSQEISDELSLSNNIYIVSCNMPYLLKYNHFEDLLEIANLVVSMHYASMTVWQSLSSKTPTIGYNYCIEDRVYFDNFPYFIVGKNEIGDAIRYWQGISKEQLDSFFYNINTETNIFNNSALNDMYMDMCRIVKQG